MMIQEHPRHILDPDLVSPKLEPSSTINRWVRRVGSVVLTYPIPTGTILLLLVSLGLWLAGQPSLAQWPLLLIVVVGSIRVVWDLFGQLRRREFGVDLIAALAIMGSLLLHEYLAGAIIVLMLSGGEALEAFALRRARTSLAALAERAPRIAHLQKDGELRDISADAVEVGMRLVVKPGELIPVDGVVISGSSNVSEADLTGEPLPVRKEAGMTTMSGSVNLDGMLQMQATRPAAESQYAQILRLMQEAQENKAPIHRLADRYSVGFTIVTLAIAGGSWLISGDSIYALAVLVVATPCPLILATPIAIMSGINTAAKAGIILKSGAAIEQLGEVEVAVFDKTGTLTMGIPQLKTVLRAENTGLTADELLHLAASIEQYSSHVLARAVVEAAQTRRLLPLSLASDVQEIFGKGVQGLVHSAVPEEAGNGHSLKSGQQVARPVAVGNRTFMSHLDIVIPPPLLEEREQCVARGEIGSFLAVDGRVVGLLVLADLPRPELERLCRDLKQAGIKETILLTGDGTVVAQRIGKLAQMDRVVANCLPEDKVKTIRTLVADHRQVLMVGDGINDAPALATASVGIAVGTGGLTAAASAADGVLLSSDMLRLVEVVRLGRWVMHVARQGIWVGMGLSGIAMIFAAFGFIEPAAGAILQEGIDVIVILNALRAGHPPSATSTPDPPVPAAVAERRAVLENLWGANIKEE
jgi:heavy metal translocating P-type ATPase